jgi:FKBP-type peptidyl-prolyl cis-trans isomerase 2
MTAIKDKDFVEIEYSGYTKENDSLFDTNIEKVAKENNIQDEKASYGPTVICIGHTNILKALDAKLIGKVDGKEYAFEVDSEHAYGKRNPKLIQLIPANKFRQQKIEPMVGLQLNIDGVFGIIKTVSSGRCLVDFNHPLAGKDLYYKVMVNRVLTDQKEKLQSLLKNYLKISDAKIEVKADSTEIKLKKDVPKEAQAGFTKVVKETLPIIKSLKFTIGQEEKNK